MARQRSAAGPAIRRVCARFPPYERYAEVRARWRLRGPVPCLEDRSSRRFRQVGRRQGPDRARQSGGSVEQRGRSCITPASWEYFRKRRPVGVRAAPTRRPRRPRAATTTAPSPTRSAPPPAPAPPARAPARASPNRPVSSGGRVRAGRPRGVRPGPAGQRGCRSTGSARPGCRTRWRPRRSRDGGPPIRA